MGGVSGQYENTIEYYDPVADTWTTTAGKLSQATVHNYGCVADNKLILMGGTATNGSVLSTIVQFSPESLLNGSYPFRTIGKLMAVDRYMACIPFH